MYKKRWNGELRIVRRVYKNRLVRYWVQEGREAYVVRSTGLVRQDIWKDVEVIGPFVQIGFKTVGEAIENADAIYGAKVDEETVIQE